MNDDENAHPSRKLLKLAAHRDIFDDGIELQAAT